MIGGGGVSLPAVQQQPQAAPKKEDPEVQEARRRAVIEERKRGRGSTNLTSPTGVQTNAPLQQARLLAR